MPTIEEQLIALVKSHLAGEDRIYQYDLFLWNKATVLKIRTSVSSYYFRDDEKYLEDVFKNIFRERDHLEEFFTLPYYPIYLPSKKRFIELTTIDGTLLLSGNWVQKIN
jgi:hypothetical protein